jgi:FkbM family methyltransferase
MKKIKSLLLSILGQKAYLRFTSRMFFIYFNNGWLRSKPNYYTHYFVKNFISEGNIVLDIGANLGYYSKQFAKLVGSSGKVYSVEPIELYRSVLTHNLAGLSNVTVLPFALGENDGTIKMGNPSTDKHRHGLMRVLTEQEQRSESSVYEVSMKNPAVLFSKFGHIDYIKCDIEGYEVPVIPIMKPVIEKNQPIVQIETDGENKTIIHKLLTDLKYSLFYVAEDKLIPYPDESQWLGGDLIGIPAGKLQQYQQFVK